MMAKDFRYYAHQCHPKPGEVWAWGGFGARIFNLMTQNGEHHQGSKPGKAPTANVNYSLRRLRHELEKDAIKSVALPRLATGVGGLEWSEVSPLIDANLGNLQIPVYVCTHYQKGEQANEPTV